MIGVDHQDMGIASMKEFQLKQASLGRGENLGACGQKSPPTQMCSQPEAAARPLLGGMVYLLVLSEEAKGQGPGSLISI